MLLVTPLTLLPWWLGVTLWTVIQALAIVGALAILGVRDLRCYALASSPFPSLRVSRGGTRRSLLVPLVALAWRWREGWARGRNSRIGLAIAAKLFVASCSYGSSEPGGTEPRCIAPRQRRRHRVPWALMGSTASSTTPTCSGLPSECLRGPQFLGDDDPGRSRRRTWIRRVALLSPSDCHRVSGFLRRSTRRRFGLDIPRRARCDPRFADRLGVLLRAPHSAARDRASALLGTLDGAAAVLT